MPHPESKLLHRLRLDFFLTGFRLLDTTCHVHRRRVATNEGAVVSESMQGH